MEDVDVKAAPISNRKFSKSDITDEKTTLLDERTFLRLRGQCR